ncbi:MAG: MFS transporter [Pseudomonadota bacterium]|nr:MFS transporter [Pseudomonadota bacterium]
MAYHHSPPTLPVAAASPQDEAMFAKISWRLLPLLIVCYIIAFIDRVNIGFAQLQMRETLPFSDAAYAFGAGVFFIGYFLFEVPSNMLLERIGARKTLLRIMFGWGLVAAAMMFVQSTAMFYTLRFLLGALEAGFFPGIILYLTYWYPSARRAKITAIFMTGATIAYLIAGPMSGAILKYMNGVMGYHGWQWMFLIQGLPASALGVLAFFYLKDKPADAPWLSQDEKARLKTLFDTDAAASQGHCASHTSMGEMLRDVRVWTMALVYFLFLGGTYVMVFWGPTLIKSLGVQDVLTVGLLSAVGPLVSIFGMVWIGRSSDRHQERRKHFLFCCALVVIGITVSILTMGQGAIAPVIAGLALMSIGQSAATPLFFTALSEYVPKKTAAVGIALISSLGNLGPAVMPSVAAALNKHTGSSVASLYLVAGVWLAAGIIMMLAVRPKSAASLRMAPA